MPVKISQLPTSTNPPNTADLLPIVQGGITKQTTLGALFSQLAAFLPSGTGAVATTVGSELENRSVNALGFAAKGDGSTDDATAINNALVKCGNAGGGQVFLPPTSANIYIIGANLKMPDNVELVALSRNTKIKLKSGANVDLVTRHPSATGLRIAIRHMTIDGNDTNNTAGGIFFDGPNNQHLPSLTLDDLLITNMRAAVGGGLTAAVLIQGNTGGIANNLDIYSNLNAIGLWHKGSDWDFHELTMASNGTTAVLQNCIIQGGGANRFESVYWGGNSGGLEQVTVWGAQGNLFSNCINDSAGQHAYRFIDSGGTPSSFNVFAGGTISNASQNTNNTYDAISMQGTESNNTFSGVMLNNTKANKARYAFNESASTGTNNQVARSQFAGFQTGIANLRAGSGSWVDHTGTFTPDLKFGGAKVGLTYTTQTARYTMNGRVVTIQIGLILSSKGSSVGAATITGLPFTAQSGSQTEMGGHAVYCDTMGSLTSPPMFYIGNNGISLSLGHFGAAQFTALADTNFNNTTNLILTGQYNV